MPVVRTDGRAYGHVITKFSGMGRLPHFLSYGASRAGGAPLILNTYRKDKSLKDQQICIWA